MNGADYLIIAVLAFSALLGMIRGFVREAIAVIAWLGGMWLAWRYAPLVEPLLSGTVDHPPASTWAARVIILVAVLILGWIVAGILSYLLQHSALSITVDRLLGLLFGVIRGAVVIAAIVMLAQFLRADQAGWYKKSHLLPFVAQYTGWIQSFAETGMKLLTETAQSSRSPLPGSPTSVPAQQGV
jgi:membrane protein required for colicin V production